MRNLLIFLTLILLAYSAPQQDLVKYKIPGYEHTWYSGYLQFNTGRYHYVYFQSQRNPGSDPLTWWFNGGPGCSSLLGMLYENGPINFKTNTVNLQLNNWSWNKQSNMLYIQTPGGVGFSESHRNNSYSDETATEDNLKAILKFYQKFPQLKKNELYITGQSYAGVYVPYVTKAILDYNKLPSRSMVINIKGFMVNNACTDPKECYEPRIAHSNSIYQYKYLFHHGFYTQNDYYDMEAVCIMGYNSKACQDIRTRLDSKFNAMNTSIYNIYVPCYYQNLSLSTQTQQYKLTQSGGQIKLVNGLSCEDQIGILHFLNEPLIKAAFHVDHFVKYENCNSDVASKYKKNPAQSFQLYKQLIKEKLRIWVVSGDHDADVPITGTLTWVERLRDQAFIPIEDPWREWWIRGVHEHDDQVGGMTWGLRGLKFVSIRGGGHMAHKDKRQASWVMIDSFLKGNNLPYNSNDI